MKQLVINTELTKPNGTYCGKAYIFRCHVPGGTFSFGWRPSHILVGPFVPAINMESQSALISDLGGLMTVGLQRSHFFLILKNCLVLFQSKSIFFYMGNFLALAFMISHVT